MLRDRSVIENLWLMLKHGIVGITVTDGDSFYPEACRVWDEITQFGCYQ